MPNKTIYVTDADLPTFERAQELAGDNLSATIAQALRRFIKAEEAKQDGYEEIRIKEGDKGTYTYKRFIGKELARTHILDREMRRATVLVVYQTAKKHYALYTKEIHNWSLGELVNNVNKKTEDLSEKIFSERLREKLNFKFNFDWDEDMALWSKPNKYRLDVYDSEEELSEHIPEDLAQAVKKALNGDSEVFLDI
ncbi:MAG TPA: EXLDI protein [Bacillales bacterium]|nr:EXLDI protein [Bacillales bacterium]